MPHFLAGLTDNTMPIDPGNEAVQMAPNVERDFSPFHSNNFSSSSVGFLRVHRRAIQNLFGVLLLFASRWDLSYGGWV